MADKVAAALTAAISRSDGTVARPLTVLMRLHQPAFFGFDNIEARLTEDRSSWEKRIVQWPHDVELQLDVDAVLRLTLVDRRLSVSPPPDDSPLSAPNIGPPFATVCIPMFRVLQPSMSLSFCTIWLGVEERPHDSSGPSRGDHDAVDRSFSESVRRGQELESPKVGITLKVSDNQAAEHDRLSMFGVVDMYADALGLVYQKADAICAELRAQIKSLDGLVIDSAARSADATTRTEHSQEVDALREEVESLRQALQRQQQRGDSLNDEVHTLKLARKNMQKRIDKLQSEAATAGRSEKISNSLLCGEDLGDSSVFAETLRRAEHLAERERSKSRALEKDLREVRHELAEALSERQKAPEMAGITLAETKKASMQVTEEAVASSVKLQEEVLQRLRREVGSLTKAKNDARRRSALLEQQLRASKRQCEDQEHTLAKGECGAVGEAMKPSTESATCAETHSQRLHEENLRLHEELRRARADACRARADLAPVRDENIRLSAEIRAILASQTRASEEALARGQSLTSLRLSREGSAKSLSSCRGRHAPRSPGSAKSLASTRSWSVCSR